MSVTTHEALPIETLEQVLATGDISKLTPAQKVAYYVRTCESLGLNPLTRPFRFLKLNNQEQLYATRDCTDQLRQVRGINLQIVDKKIEAGVLIVTVRAQTKDGRHDEDIGAVMLPQSGESRANAVMKAITKAKRRVTLSICGLGLTDESELDTMPGAYTYDPSDPAPTIDADTPPDARDALNAAVPMKPVPLTKPAKGDRFYREPPSQPPPEPKTAHPLDEHDGTKWLSTLESLLVNAQSQDEVVEIAGHPSVGTAVAKAPAGVRARVSELLSDAYGRFPETADADASHEPANAA